MEPKVEKTEICPIKKRRYLF